LFSPQTENSEDYNSSTNDLFSSSTDEVFSSSTDNLFSPSADTFDSSDYLDASPFDSDISTDLNIEDYLFSASPAELLDINSTDLLYGEDSNVNEAKSDALTDLKDMDIVPTSNLFKVSQASDFIFCEN